MSYAELYCQSNFSFLTGASHPEELVMQASFYGYSAIAITDECSVAGVVRAYSEIKENNLKVKLIVGSLFKLADELELVLLCPDRKAYAELCRIITNSRRRCEKGHYQLSQWDLMSIKHCLLLWKPNGDSAIDQEWALWLLKYHQGRLYLAYQRHLTDSEHHYLSYCQSLHQQYQIEIVACGGSLMHSPERLSLQHTLTAIKQGTEISKVGRSLLSNSEHALRPIAKLLKLFEPQWLLNGRQLAAQCKFDLSELRYEYPGEIIPAQQTPTQYLRHLTEQGILLRFPQGITKDIRATIEKELELIAEQNYEYFFLTIYDIVRFAKERGILYQGRGSAANSIVCYCLEITSVDPQQISVLFERFISKERNEPPDIDVDFEHQRREEIFQYIYSKYGRERAALAATVISYRLRSAINDVGKALGINQTSLRFIVKNLNRRDRAISWQDQVCKLGIAPDSVTGRHFLSLVNEILSFPRHLSQHVGGFIISAGPLYELVPVENAAMADRTVIQWDKNDLATLGLLKVDVLALGMLTAIKKSFAMIDKHYQHQYSIAQITRMSDDPQVYQMIRQADTVGVFQIESRAQMSMLPRLKPRCYYDLVIQIAIVRPGPIQGNMVHPYLKRRNGDEQVDYPSTAVKEVLSRTLGVPIFQEQVIKLAMVAAGFTGGEADQLRRAMAKWQRNGQLNQFKDKLVNGMEQRGYSTEYALRIFAQICGFGEYGFPESHSASFAVLAYVSAWLKTYYPEVFYCALLNAHPMGFYSPSQLIQDARRHKIKILPVCINRSEHDHCLEPLAYKHEPSADIYESSTQINEPSAHKENKQLALRLGFRLIKGLSARAVTKLVANRPDGGYQQLYQVKQLGLRQNDIQALASSNALAIFGDNRYVVRWLLMDNLDELPLFKDGEFKGGDLQNSDEQTSFNEPQFPYLTAPSAFDGLNEDYATTGLSLDHHPIALLRSQRKQILGRYTPANQLTTIRHQSPVTVVGVVTGRQSPGTASGVTFVTLEDDTGNCNIVVWVATARAQQKPFLKAKIMKVKGILEREGDVCHIIAGKLIDLSDEFSQLAISSRDFH